MIKEHCLGAPAIRHDLTVVVVLSDHERENVLLARNEEVLRVMARSDQVVGRKERRNTP